MKLRNQNRNSVKRSLIMEDHFLEENQSKIDINSDYDTNNSNYGNLSNVDKYGKAPDKSFYSEADAELRRKKKSLYDSDFETGIKST